jgi:predicted Rossmann-fold nucleotide-binding protein
VNFEALARHGVIAPEDLELFRFADTPQAALDILKREIDTMPPKPTPAFAHSTTRPKRAT